LAKSDYSPLFVALAFRTDCNIAILILKSSSALIWLPNVSVKGQFSLTE